MTDDARALAADVADNVHVAPNGAVMVTGRATAALWMLLRSELQRHVDRGQPAPLWLLTLADQVATASARQRQGFPTETPKAVASGDPSSSGRDPAGLLGTPQAADLLGISRQRVGQIAKAGRLPGAVQTGNRWQIPLDALLAYQADRQRDDDADQDQADDRHAAA